MGLLILSTLDCSNRKKLFKIYSLSANSNYFRSETAFKKILCCVNLYEIPTILDYGVD